MRWRISAPLFPASQTHQLAPIADILSAPAVFGVPKNCRPAVFAAARRAGMAATSSARYRRTSQRRASTLLQQPRHLCIRASGPATHSGSRQRKDAPTPKLMPICSVQSWRGTGPPPDPCVPEGRHACPLVKLALGPSGRLIAVITLGSAGDEYSARQRTGFPSELFDHRREKSVGRQSLSESERASGGAPPATPYATIKRASGGTHARANNSSHHTGA